MSQGFNLKDYITVKERKQMFYSNYPNGVIIPSLVSDVVEINEYVVFKAEVWKHTSDYRNNLSPDGVGYSYSKAGGRQADRYAWTENCEESAIGRALDNMGYAVDGKCSREEIEKVEYMSTIKQTAQEIKENVKSVNQPEKQNVSQKPKPTNSTKAAPKETPKEEKVPMIREGQIEGIKKSIDFLVSKSNKEITVKSFLEDHMKLDKELEELTFQEAVESMKMVNKLMSEIGN